MPNIKNSSICAINQCPFCKHTKTIDEQTDIYKQMLYTARFYYGQNITPVTGKTWAQSFWPVAEIGKLLLCFNISNDSTKTVSYNPSKKTIEIGA